MCSELESITSSDQVPVCVLAFPVDRAHSSSAAERGRRTWDATIALSYSHQPESVNVRSTVRASGVLLSISIGTVNCAPTLGSMPSRESTRVSVAASSVPSRGRLPSTGSMK